MNPIQPNLKFLKLESLDPQSATIKINGFSRPIRILDNSAFSDKKNAKNRVNFWKLKTRLNYKLHQVKLGEETKFVWINKRDLKNKTYNLSIKKIWNLSQNLTLDDEKYAEQLKTIKTNLKIRHFFKNLNRGFKERDGRKISKSFWANPTHYRNHFIENGQIFIHFNKIKNGDAIVGEGAQGKKIKYALSNDGKIYVISSWNAENKNQTNSKEIDSMLEVKGLPNVLNLSAHVTRSSKKRKNTEKTYMITEYAPGGTLDAEKFTSLTESKQINWAIQILKSIHAIHEKGLIHADIKPMNIFIGIDKNRNQYPIIADFGFSSKIGSSVNKSGTQGFLHPKTIDAIKYRKKIEMNKDLDTFAAGRTLFFLKDNKAFNNIRLHSGMKHTSEFMGEEPADQNSLDYVIWKLCDGMSIPDAIEKLKKTTQLQAPESN